MKSYRQIVWVALLLVPLLWWAWPDADEPSLDESRPGVEGQGEVLSSTETPSASEEGPRRTRADPRDPAAKPLEAPASPEVDEILVDESITIEQAAVRLRALASDTTQTKAHRLEALQHGLNLGIEAFADFAEQADQAELPAELASHFLDEIINYNDAPATQIRSYVALIDHSDVEVRELALEMLRFQVGDDLHEESLERLKEMAREKIQALENPVPEEQPGASPPEERPSAAQPEAQPSAAE